MFNIFMLIPGENKGVTGPDPLEGCVISSLFGGVAASLPSVSIFVGKDWFFSTGEHIGRNSFSVGLPELFGSRSGWFGIDIKTKSDDNPFVQRN